MVKPVTLLSVYVERKVIGFNKKTPFDPAMAGLRVGLWPRG
jgi:hypothetical protein